MVKRIPLALGLLLLQIFALFANVYAETGAVGSTSSPIVATSKKTLVLVDDLSIRSSHSRFFSILEQRGYELTFSQASSSAVILQKHGIFLYDYLVLMAPETDDFGTGVRVPEILSFIDSGRSVFAAVGSSESVSEPMRELGAEVGVDFDEDGSLVIDHFHPENQDDAFHTTVSSDRFVPASVVVGSDGRKQPVLFRGIGMSVQSDNELAFPVLSAHSTAFSADPSSRPSPTVATSTSSKSSTATSSASSQFFASRLAMVAALQARNNARVAIAASLDMLSNSFFDARLSSTGERAGNEAFFANLLSWTFQERGILRYRNIQHTKLSPYVDESPKEYRINDILEYSVFIEEWDGASQQWVPYIADDIQLEFVMLDPWVRTGLKVEDPKTGRYAVTFRVPDVYGVYKFKIDYHRRGYSSLDLWTQIPVRPFNLGEFERFIYSARPYYNGAFTAMAGFFIFGAVFLYHRDK